MRTTARIDSELTTRHITRARRTGRADRRHKLPLCPATGLARYRDRHQARDGAQALGSGTHTFEVHTFACPDCRGFHLEKTHLRTPITVGSIQEPAEAFTASLTSRNRRYVLVDIENPTRGAHATCEEVASFWAVLTQQAPGIASHDHVVVGAARNVVRKYRAAIHGTNVKWVVGPDSPNGADRALLAAIDLYRVARTFDELVIVSGDHAFVELARRAKALGLSVHVVTAQHPQERTMLSRDLAAVADTRTLVRLRASTLARATVTAAQDVARASRSAHVATVAA
ncbi:NYN domain-containing protein [Georgenia muralis]